jgi:GT2 family glycosyltransferase
VDLYLDDVPAAQVTPSLFRPDVGRAWPSIPGSDSSGFAVRIGVDTLSPGGHELKVAVHDHAGRTRVLRRVIETIDGGVLYHQYFCRTLPSAERTRELRRHWLKRRAPMIHVAIVARGDDDLVPTLRSLQGQEGPQWSATLLVDAPPSGSSGRYRDIDPSLTERVRVVHDPSAILPDQPDRDRYVGFLHAGEVLAPMGLARFLSDLDTRKVGFIYSDHDAIEPTGRHVDPWFLPTWSPDRLLAQDYIGGFFLARDGQSLRRALRHVPVAQPAWRYRLVLGLSPATDHVRHVPEVLWSRNATSVDQDLIGREEAAAVLAAVTARNAEAEVRSTGASRVRRIVWPLKVHPKVSVVVPTTGRKDLVQMCLRTLLKHTTWDDLQIVFVDNSRGRNPDGISLLREAGVTVLERDEPFNWAKLNNAGARASDGEVLLFLNDDIEAGEDASWLESMVRLVMRPEIGAVGPLLSYPDGRIQHGGVFLVGHGGGAMHLLHRVDPTQAIPQSLHQVTRETSAVTGACLMVRRDAFEDIGGFDEELSVVGNDIDFCLRLTRHGFRNLWTSDAVLVHHESLSRAQVSYFADERRMWDRWGERLKMGDPFYNPNLSQTRPDLALAWEGAPPHDQTVDPDPSAGVNLVGYVRAEMGVGEAARGHAQALTDAGIPFVIIDHAHGNPARMGDESWLHKVVRDPVYDVNIVYVNAESLGHAMSLLPPGLRGGRYTIGAWAWELPVFPDRWLDAFKLVDEVWVPSEFVRAAVSADSPVPVVRMPHAVRLPRGPFLDRQHFGLGPDRFQFLAMYDANSVRQRKNPEGAVQAFCRAFDSTDESVCLVIKVNNADEQERRALARLRGSHPGVRVIDGVLDRREVDSLLASSDCFVSLHRAEGFGLPIAEAMALGKPVIATGWSGNMDFMDETNAACIGYRLTRIGRDLGPYDADQTWAEPDIDDAAAWMRRLREDPAVGRDMGRMAAATIAGSFSSAVLGRATDERLRAIRKARSTTRLAS